MSDVVSQALPIPSSTVIILRESPELEVLLLKRNERIAFHGGSWVFPGGKVEQNDLPNGRNRFDDLSDPEKEQTFKRAAIRESKEEAGIDLFADDLFLCSRWLTPVQMPKRFDASFYICKCPAQNIRIDDSEIKDFKWVKPKIALDLQSQGSFRLPPPTYVTLQHLHSYPTVNDAIEQMSKSPINFKPKIVSVDNGFVSLYEEDAGYFNSNIDAQGNRHRLVLNGDNFSYVRDYLMAEPVVQEEVSGCGIASAANILGKSYTEMKAIANSLGIFAEDEALWSSTEYVRTLLADSGVQTAPNEIAFTSWENLPDLALLSIKPYQQDGKDFWHWVVFKRVKGEAVVLDSASYLSNNVRTDFDAMEPNWFIEVK